MLRMTTLRRSESDLVWLLPFPVPWQGWWMARSTWTQCSTSVTESDRRTSKDIYSCNEGERHPCPGKGEESLAVILTFVPDGNWILGYGMETFVNGLWLWGLRYEKWEMRNETELILFCFAGSQGLIAADQSAFPGGLTCFSDWSASERHHALRYPRKKFIEGQVLSSSSSLPQQTQSSRHQLPTFLASNRKVFWAVFRQYHDFTHLTTLFSV